MKKILLLPLIFFSCSEIKDVKSVVIENNSKWVEYYNKGNAKGIASLHTLDAVVIPPKTEFVVGRDAIEKMYEAEIELGNGTLDLKTREVIQEGIYAYETGLYILKMNIKGEEVNDNGKFIVVWEKQENGEWLCKKDIWNTSVND
ncbi:MAG: YybH family protein [Flavobacteriaceae bacterium]